MSKRGVLWGLGGLLSVAVVTLCLLLVTTMGANSQSSVEPKLTNLPTAEASYHAIARTPGVEPGPPLVPSFFQLVDIPTVSLDPLPPQITEGENLTVTVRLSHAVSDYVEVGLEFSGGFVGFRNLIFYPGSQSEQLIIYTIDDEFVQGSRNVLLQLDVINPEFIAGVEFGEFILLDNEPTVSFDPLPPRVTEGEALTVTARLNRVVDFDVTVSLDVLFDGCSFDDPRCSPPDPDIELSRSMATIPAGGLTTTFIINTIDDDAFQNDKDALLLLNVVSPKSDVGTGVRVSFTLVDNEPAVSLDPLPSLIVEGEALTVTARLNRVLDYTVTVRLEVDVFLDIGPPDYTLSRLTATIPAGELFTTFVISTIDDDAYEGEEFVELDLRVVSPELDVFVKEEFRAFTLVDNDPRVSFDGLPSLVTEGEALTVTARLDIVEDFTVTVHLGVLCRYNDDPFCASDDFTFPPTITIPAGDLTTTFIISTIDDDVFENNKYDITLIPGRRGSKHFLLVDNDPPITLSPSPDPLPEQITEGDVLTVTVRLNRVVDFTVTVRLEVWVDGCPFDDPYCGPPDFELSRSIATIPVGELSATFIISTIDDDLFKNDKDVALLLSVVNTEFDVRVESGFRHLRLVDDELVPSISFVEAASTIAEDAANSRHDIGLWLSGALRDDITIAFTVSGSATRGVDADYTLTATVVMIPGGTSNGIIRLDVNNDELYEGLESERIILSLVNATGGVTVDDTKSEHTVTITDDDPPPQGCSLNRRSITEVRVSFWLAG